MAMKLNREILRLAGPSILANITVPLVGMADIAVVGHLGTTGGVSGAALIGGISVGTMLFDLLYWNLGFLRAGTGGLTAQAYGRLNAGSPGTASGARSAQNAPEIVSILGRALRIAALSGLALVALQWVVVQLAFLVVQCSPEVRTLATQYFYIRIWAAPATLLQGQPQKFRFLEHRRLPKLPILPKLPRFLRHRRLLRPPHRVRLQFHPSIGPVSSP